MHSKYLDAALIMVKTLSEFIVYFIYNIVLTGVSTAAAVQERNEMNEDRNVHINSSKEVPFTLSHLTINGNFQFNVN